MTFSLQNFTTKLPFLILILLICAASFLAYERFQFNSNKSYLGSDIEAIWKEGQQICALENPYSRFLSEAQGAKFKPPTYLPAYYVFSCAIDLITGHNFKNNLKIIGLINSILYLSIGVIIASLFLKIKHPWLAVCFVSLWFFSRWTLHTLASQQINFFAILPLMLATLYINSNKKLSFILLGCSLAIKQVAIFTLPLFLILAWQKNNLKSSLKNILILISLPVAISIPFIIHDLSGFLASLAYSTNREAEPAFSAMPEWFFPLILLLSLFSIYLYFINNRNQLALSIFLVFLVFCALNRVVFNQYYLWAMVTFIIAAYDYTSKERVEP